MKTTRNLILSVCVLMGLAQGTKAVNWYGGTSDDWFTGANWSDSNVPDNADTVYLGYGGNDYMTATVDIDDDAGTIVAMTVGYGHSSYDPADVLLTLKSNAVLTTTGDVFLSNFDKADAKAVMNVEPGATLNVGDGSGDNLEIVYQTGTVNIGGTIAVNQGVFFAKSAGSTGNISITNNGTLSAGYTSYICNNTTANGTLEVRDNGQFTLSGASAGTAYLYANYGTFTIKLVGKNAGIDVMGQFLIGNNASGTYECHVDDDLSCDFGGQLRINTGSTLTLKPIALAGLADGNYTVMTYASVYSGSDGRVVLDSASESAGWSIDSILGTSLVLSYASSSTPTYALTVEGGSGSGSYTNGHQAPIIGYEPEVGQVFTNWSGATDYVNDLYASNTFVTMPAFAIAVTANYYQAVSVYPLTVNNGTGGGMYTSGTVVNIAASIPPVGQAFNVWTGDTTFVASVSSTNTTLTMPAAAQSVTATYTNLPTKLLTVNGGSGGGNYAVGVVVTIQADPPPYGQVFDTWTGDTASIANSGNAVTTLTMPDAPQTIATTYTAATVFQVAASGYLYSTIQDAVNAAVAANGGLVRIMDSSAYDETVTLGVANGNAGEVIYVEARAGQTPSLKSFSSASDMDIWLRGLIFDDAIGATPGELLRVLDAGSLTVESCTFKGSGTAESIDISGLDGAAHVIRDCLFTSGANSNNVIVTGTTPGYADDFSLLVENNTFDRAVNGSFLFYRSYLAQPSAVTIRYNVMDGSDGVFSGIYALLNNTANGPTGLTIENNTFYRLGVSGGNTSHGAIIIRNTLDNDFGATVRNNLFVGKGAAINSGSGLRYFDTAGPADINADNNGFFDMYETTGPVVGQWPSTNPRFPADLNAFASAGNNFAATNSPLVSPASGDYRLLTSSVAVTAASNGGYIGARPPIPPTGSFIILR